MATNYSNVAKDGYLAKFQEKLQEKPDIKKYSLNDYRNLKKEIQHKNATDTGKLGFDPSNETFKQKAEIAAKKLDYAEKVKERNRMMISDKQRPKNSPQLQNSKPKTAARPRSISPMEFPNNEEPPENMTLVRIRDPVTGVIKKMYINEIKKEKLNENKELKKVHSFVGHQSRVSVRSDISSNIMNEFYRQENVQEFENEEDYQNFLKDDSVIDQDLNDSDQVEKST